MDLHPPIKRCELLKDGSFVLVLLDEVQFLKPRFDFQQPYRASAEQFACFLVFRDSRASKGIDVEHSLDHGLSGHDRRVGSRVLLDNLVFDLRPVPKAIKEPYVDLDARVVVRNCRRLPAEATYCRADVQAFAAGCAALTVS
jgi:hypothetical protein